MFLAGACCLALLAGCAAPLAALDGMGPMGQTLRYAVTPASHTLRARLAPGHEYMQVRVDGRESVLALGRRVAVQAGDAAAQAEDEYWYSPQSELIQLRDGRLWRVVGMTSEWRRQQARPPAWAEVPEGGEAVLWTRQVDRMPGYRWSEQDRVRTRRMQAAPSAVPAAQGAHLQWFEEQVQTRDGAGREWVFVQYFGLSQGRVVYSQQCVDRDLCLVLVRM